MTQHNNTPKNVKFFAELSGMPEIVVNAIIACEGQATPNPTNPFNIRYYGSHQLQIGHNEDGFGVYHTAEDGLRDAWATLHLPYYSGVRAAIATHDPYTIARAWENSPWASNHYGSDGQTPGCIAQKVMKASVRKFKIKVVKFAHPQHWHVKRRQTLYGYDPRQPGSPVTVKKFQVESGAMTDAKVWITWEGESPYPVPHGGPFLRVIDGVFKGRYIVEGLVALDE